MGSLAATERCTILLFYHYVRPAAMSFQRTEQLKDFLEKVTTEVAIGGRIRSVVVASKYPRPGATPVHLGVPTGPSLSNGIPGLVRRRPLCPVAYATARGDEA